MGHRKMENAAEKFRKFLITSHIAYDIKFSISVAISEVAEQNIAPLAQIAPTDRC